MNGPGTRILYRDLRLEGRFTLQLTVFYAGTGPFSSPATLAHDAPEANQQFRIDLLRPSAPIDSVAKDDVLVNVFHTSPGDPARRPPTEVRVDVSAWAGQTARLRLAPPTIKDRCASAWTTSGSSASVGTATAGWSC
jgi:hypothetical protein